MPRSVNEIAADFDALTAADFDLDSDLGVSGWEKLDRLCSEMRELNDPSACAPVMFRTMERLDNTDLGVPGPLVHTLELWALESWWGEYETLLADSVRRKPSPLTVWMVNRILNIHPPNRDMWLALLASSIEHPLASESTKEDAATFLEHQTGA